MYTKKRLFLLMLEVNSVAYLGKGWTIKDDTYNIVTENKSATRLLRPNCCFSRPTIFTKNNIIIKSFQIHL